MKTTTIRVPIPVYNKLSKEKRNGESFGGLLLRLLGEHNKELEELVERKIEELKWR